MKWSEVALGRPFSVTLADGSQWLVHKGGGFGQDSQTVVTSTRHMNSGWRVKLYLHVYSSVRWWNLPAQCTNFLIYSFSFLPGFNSVSCLQVVETKNFQGTKTVSDFVKAGGSDYSLIFDNCHMGAGQMMNQWLTWDQSHRASCAVCATGGRHQHRNEDRLPMKQ